MSTSELNKQTVTIKKILFSSDDFIIAITDKDKSVQGNIHHKPKEIEGETLELVGGYKEHPKYGTSFHFTHYTVAGNYDMFFLTKMVKGITKKAAREILDKCGNRLDYIIENEPRALLSIRGIGEKKLQNIIDTFIENKPLKELSEYLLPFGITVNKIRQIHEYYLKKESSAILEIKKNPYILTRMDGVGFKRADDIALRMGTDVDSPFRIQSGIIYAIEKHCQEHGHTYAVIDALFQQTKEILDIEANKEASLEYQKNGFVLEYKRYKVEIDYLLSDNKRIGAVDSSREKISLPHLIKAEEYIEETLNKYAWTSRGDILPDIEAYIDHKEQKNGFKFGKKQKEAIILGNKNYPIFFVYGLAGSGKTTTAKDISYIYETKVGKDKIVCCALSGVAAGRAGSVTGYASFTIHSLLGYQGKNGWEYNENNKLPYEFILLDEASMTDAWLFSLLLKAIDFEGGATLQITGDPSQLQSVGAGDVFRNIIDRKLAHGVGLDEVFRQNTDQVINVFATDNIRRGKVPKDYKSTSWEDFSFYAVEIHNSWGVKKSVTANEWSNIKEANNIKIKNTIVSIAERYRWISNLYTKDIKEYISAFQVITPQKKRELGVYALNNAIQEVLNPTKYKNTLVLETKKIKPRDKVIHLQNDNQKVCTTEEYKKYHKNMKALLENETLLEKRVFNGQIGVVINIDLENNIIAVYYPNENYVTFYTKEDVNKNKLDLSFAISIHKSQGSEYTACVVPATSSHYMMLNNQLMYTAVTRAKKELYIVGESYAFEKGCKEILDVKRDTILSLEKNKEYA